MRANADEALVGETHRPGHVHVISGPLGGEQPGARRPARCRLTDGGVALLDLVVVGHEADLVALQVAARVEAGAGGARPELELGADPLGGDLDQRRSVTGGQAADRHLVPVDRARVQRVPDLGADDRGAATPHGRERARDDRDAREDR